MGEQGSLLAIETVILPGNQADPGKFMDLSMLALLEGGRERTESEYRDLFKAAGFKVTKIVPTDSQVSAIEAVKENNSL